MLTTNHKWCGLANVCHPGVARERLYPRQQRGSTARAAAGAAAFARRTRLTGVPLMLRWMYS